MMQTLLDSSPVLSKVYDSDMTMSSVEGVLAMKEDERVWGCRWVLGARNLKCSRLLRLQVEREDDDDRLYIGWMVMMKEGSMAN